jgi:hypothetical protein
VQDTSASAAELPRPRAPTFEHADALRGAFALDAADIHAEIVNPAARVTHQVRVPCRMPCRV